MRMRTTQPFPLPTPFIFSLAADVTGSSTQCRSLRFTHPTHAAAGAASHRRSEDKLRVYFSVFLPRFLGFLFLPRNELSGGPPPAHPDTHIHTSPPPPYTQTHALTHTYAHTPAAALQAPPPLLLLLILPLPLLLDVVDYTRWWHGGVLI